jgi:hypothetical protein
MFDMTAKKTGAKKDLSTGAKMGIGIGLTAAAVAAAGAYFLVGSKNAVQNRKKVKGWTLKAKGEVLEALEKAQEITAEEYNDLVTAAVGAYGTVKEASKGEIKDFKDEMLQHWKKLEKSNAVKKLTKKGVKPAAKKVAKKAAKKVAK